MKFLLVSPSDTRELRKAILKLWSNSRLCRNLGKCEKKGAFPVYRRKIGSKSLKIGRINSIGGVT